MGRAISAILDPVAVRPKWHVLYVKSRQEKALAEDLDGMEIGYYLPLLDEIRFHGSRRCRVTVPLFPGYLFLYGTMQDVYRADRTHRLIRFIPVPVQEQLEEELRNIRLVLDAEGQLAPHRLLNEGSPVEVRSGPFRGLRGVVEDATKMNRIILQVRTLGRAVSMEIDAGLLEVSPSI
jgi:transcriptional antiterminator NusG